ncbi:hypothetical protein OAU50_02075 [Planctomycetota bacterium]|nr:hypothetical protein [Planctomycetota bacterium]
MRTILTTAAVMALFLLATSTPTAKGKSSNQDWQEIELPAGADLSKTWLLHDKDNVFGWFGNGYYALKDGEISKLDIEGLITLPEKAMVRCAGRLILSSKEKTTNTLGYLKDGQFKELATDDGKHVVFNDGTCSILGCTSGDPNSPYMAFQVNDGSRCVPIVFDGKGISLLTPPEGFKHGRVGKFQGAQALFQYGGPIWIYREGKPVKLLGKDDEPFKCPNSAYSIKTAGDYISFIKQGSPSKTWYVDDDKIKEVDAERPHNLFQIKESVFLMAGDAWPISLYQLKKNKAKRHSPANKVVGNFANWFDGRGEFGVGAKWGERGSILIRLDDKKAKDITLPKDVRKFGIEGVMRANDDCEEFMIHARTAKGLLPLFVGKDNKVSVYRNEEDQPNTFESVSYGFDKSGTYMVVNDGTNQKLLYRAR